MLFISSAENQAFLVNLRSKAVVRTYSSSAASQYGINFLPLTNHVVLHQENGCSAFFGFHTKQVLQRSLTSESLRSSVVTSCGSFMIGGGVNGTLFVWNTYTGQLVRVFAAHFRSINCLQCSSDNYVVLTCSDDSSCKVWLLSSLTSLKIGAPNPLTVFTQHTLPISSCTFLSETKLAVTGSKDKSCKVFNALSGKEYVTLVIGKSITCVVGRSRTIVVGTEDGYIYSINVDDKDNYQNKNFVINGNSITDVHSPVVFISFFTEDPSLLLVAFRNGSIRSYNAHNGTPRDEIFNVKKNIFSVCYTRDLSETLHKEVKINKNPLDLSLSSYTVCSKERKLVSTESPVNKEKNINQLLSELKELDDLKRTLTLKLQ